MQVFVNDWPKNLEEFKNHELFDLRYAENTFTLFILALDLFVHHQQEGVEAINLLKGPIELNPHEISFLKDRLLDKPYLPKAYFDGAAARNDYEPTVPLSITFYPNERPQDLEENYMRLYVKTQGADAKRFITFRKKDDFWYLWEYPGILMDIRKPKSLDPWT